MSEGVRRCTLAEGGNLVEPIVEHSDEDRFYVYEIAEGPFPMSSYRARISVEDAEGGSRVTWHSDFEPEDPAAEQDLSETVAAIFRAALEAIPNRCA